jgi:ABC-2 type transport system permease protein
VRALKLARFFLKMHLRDRQAIVFSLFFPIAFMLALGFTGRAGGDAIELGIVGGAEGELAGRLVEDFVDNPLFEVSEGSEEQLKAALIEGDVQLVLVLPEQVREGGSANELRLLVDRAQTSQLGFLLPAFEKALVGVERELRETDPLFALHVEDVKARSQGYLDFLVPGLLAFTLMQISIAGSGFNLVEYRRKGILKRLFVTPLRPRDFILGLVLARLVLSVVQLSVLLGVAVFLLDVSVAGDPLSLYAVIVLGTILFLSLGFCLGSLAKTQQSILAVGNLFIFPQVFLSGIFFPVDSLPEMIQPLAKMLPLTFIAQALREIANNGLSLFELGPQLVGIAVWLVIAFFLATRLFVWKEVAN